jgi:hypothetical protein
MSEKKNLKDCVFLDSIAANLLEFFTNDHISVFTGDNFNDLARQVMQIRYRFMHEMIEAGLEKRPPLFLHKDISLVNFAQESMFLFSSVEDFKKVISSPPVLLTERQFSNWRNHPDYPMLGTIFPDIDLVLGNQHPVLIVDGEQYGICVIRPHFPDWYIYHSNENKLSHQNRRDLLAVAEGLYETMDDLPNGISDDEVSEIIYKFLDDVVPLMPSTNEIAPLFATILKLCGLKYGGEVKLLPMCHQKILARVIHTLVTPSVIPELLQRVRNSS